MPHIEEGQLHALLDGAYQGDSPEARAIHAHLSACTDCRSLLESERVIRERAHDLLERARPLPETIPPFDTIVRRSRPQRAALLPPARLAWAASVLIAIGLGWFGRDLNTRRSVQMTQESLAAGAPPTAADSLRTDARAPSASDAAASAVEPASPPPASASAPSPDERALADRRAAPPPEQTNQAQAKTRVAEEGVIVSAPARATIGAVQGGAAMAPAAPPSVGWSEVSLEVAERTAGRRVLLMPGYELVKLELMPAANGYSVRTAQRIPGDGLLELIQEPASDPSALARESRRGRTFQGEAAVSSTGTPAVTLQIGDLRITGRAAISADSLRVLLGRLR